MEQAIAGIGVIILMILIVILGPLLTIWALNTLFPVLHIPFTWQTWGAALVLGGLFKTTVNSK